VVTGYTIVATEAHEAREFPTGDQIARDSAGGAPKGPTAKLMHTVAITSPADS